jgi:hypothetical protein
MDPYDEYDFDPPDDEAIDALGELGAAADDVDHATPHVKPYNLRADAGASLETDLDCIHCGYNLRGQRTDGNCSECGTPITHSMRSDLLKFADTRWLRGLKQGVMWVLIGTFTGIGMAMVAGGAEAALQVSAASSSFNQQATVVPPQSMLLVAINFVAVLVPNAMTGFGYWQLTAPEPPPSKPRVARPLTRWTLLPANAISILAALVLVGQSEATTLASAGLDGVAGVLALIGFIALMLYLRLLAIRGQDRGLAQQTKIVMWGLIAVGVAFILAVIVFAALAGLSSPSPNNMLGLLFVVGCPLLLAFFVFAIWWVVLLFFYQSRFTKVINLSIKHRRAMREHAVA